MQSCRDQEWSSQLYVSRVTAVHQPPTLHHSCRHWLLQACHKSSLLPRNASGIRCYGEVRSSAKESKACKGNLPWRRQQNTRSEMQWNWWKVLVRGLWLACDLVGKGVLKYLTTRGGMAWWGGGSPALPPPAPRVALLLLSSFKHCTPCWRSLVLWSSWDSWWLGIKGHVKRLCDPQLRKLNFSPLCLF